MLNPSSSHAWRRWTLRVLQSPLLLLAQIRSRAARGGGGSSSPVLPLYAPVGGGRGGGGGGFFDDSQAKHGKSKTLLQDLACFAFFLLCIFALLHALWPATTATVTTAAVAGSADDVRFVEVEIADDQPDSLALPAPPVPVQEERVAELEPPQLGEPDRSGIDAAQSNGRAEATRGQQETETKTKAIESEPAAPGTDHVRAAPTPVSTSGPTVAAGDEAYAALTASRRQAVREAFLHTWRGYEKYAWGHDELRPVSNATNDSWGGWGATLVDGLDTAMLMGLDEEVARARKHVETIDFNKDYVASFFETTIRYLGQNRTPAALRRLCLMALPPPALAPLSFASLFSLPLFFFCSWIAHVFVVAGGLLGAYEISRDGLYLQKATQLADLLMACFDSTASGLPQSKVNLATGACSNQRWAGGSILAEVGSVQLEMEYLSFHTGDPSYAAKARKVYTLLDQAEKDVKGLYPTYIDPQTGRFTNSHVSFGSFGDSFYEYTLKLWLLTDRRDQDALRMWNEAMAAMETHLLRTRVVEHPDERALPAGGAAASSLPRVQREYAFVGELTTHPGGGGSGTYLHKMEHLTCFLPGLLALGVSAVADEALRAQSGLATMRTSEAHAVMQHAHETTQPGHAGAAAVAAESDPTAAGAGAGALTPEEEVLRAHAGQHVRASTALLRTCTAAYHTTSTGLAPETIDFGVEFSGGGSRGPASVGAGQGAQRDTRPPLQLERESDVLGALFTVDQPKYILRPETLESILVLYRLTGDESYREEGWRIFENIKRSCKTPSAFSAIKDVNIGRGRGGRQGAADTYSAQQTQQGRAEYSSPENWTDSQESFFLAETLKYLYLLFSDPDFLPLDRYVFNTEAHPLGVLVKH